jgi:hypothetical protein
MKTVDPQTLKKNHVYRLEYKIQSGNYSWYRYTSIMTFLGFDNGNLLFNLRPLAGTQSLRANCLLVAEDLGESTARSNQAHRSPHSLGRLKKEKS